ncbi:MAG: hypothetical protein ABJH05_18390 [Fulvivirga sp.]
MKNIYLVLLILTLLSFGCNSNKTETQSEEPETTTSTSVESHDVEGFDTIEELAASVLQSLKDRDHDSYFIHVMDEKMELEQAELIKDSTIRKEFLHEYGFSLHEEKEYFDNLLHFYDTKDINLDKAVLADLDYVEYKGGEYQPLELYEVFIPIEMEYELLIDFTAIKVDGKYYLTSELGI